MSGQWLTRSGLCGNLSQLNMVSWLCYTAVASALQIWQGILCEQKFSLLPQLLEGILAVSMLYRWFVKCNSPIFAFCDSYIIILLITVPWWVKTVYSGSQIAFWLQSGWDMSSNEYKIIDIAYFRRFCNRMIISDICPLIEIFFSWQCKGISHRFKVKHTFVISLVSNDG